MLHLLSFESGALCSVVVGAHRNACMLALIFFSGLTVIKTHYLNLCK